MAPLSPRARRELATAVLRVEAQSTRERERANREIGKLQVAPAPPKCGIQPYICSLSRRSPQTALRSLYREADGLRDEVEDDGRMASAIAAATGQVCEGRGGHCMDPGIWSGTGEAFGRVGVRVGVTAYRAHPRRPRPSRSSTQPRPGCGLRPSNGRSARGARPGRPPQQVRSGSASSRRS
jgi:hypothetical protein